ncbi:hypothetical protein HYH03_003114 [Edaphochlamys debaryana]|uniref:RecF/RecN/SMC N-terminal domain-containing protein n=1 Tax=Edaphochlamys debaryana TaxID=47281 RepID=A0A836C4M3_9CHLO|nr:hypothetical protein HYH03_003114 [Edaphochlamys debaryana]|eukprot:KAG2498924.1 hypothetical protein HYH03_003114 [Edaphochlamys debaryana]
MLPRALGLPVKLEAPEDARRYVGFKLIKEFDVDGKGLKPFVGTVRDVVIEGGVAYLQVTYHDGDTEEFWWSDFRRYAVSEEEAAAMEAAIARAEAEAAAATAGAAAPAAPGAGTGQAPHTPAEVRASAAAPHAPHAAAHSAPPHEGTGAAPRKRKAAVRDEAARAEPESPTPVRQRRPSAGGTPATVRRPHSREGRADAAGEEEEEEGEEGEEEGEEEEDAHAAARPPVRRRLDLGTAPAHGGPGPSAGPALAPARAPALQGHRGPMGQAGHLHRIQLVNFMCHANMECEFGRHVTFITGHNGSGKSAVLQCLQACLGASARETGRGTNLAGWVMTGRDRASVTLELWNTSAEQVAEQRMPPFCYATYGPKIKIMRRITLNRGAGGRVSAASQYHLYNAEGKEIKFTRPHTAAQELSALVAHFNIDTSNPLVVITQDGVRGFHQVHKSGAASCSKYRMYMDGTCLSATRDDLARAAGKVLAARQNQQEASQRLQGRKAELQELETKLVELERVATMKRHLGDFECAAAYAVVRDWDAALVKLRRALSVRPELEAAAQAVVAQADAAFKELEGRERELQAEMDRTEIPNLAQSLDELQRARTRARDRARTAARQITQLQSRRSQAEEQVEEDEKALEAHRNGADMVAAMRAHQEQVDAKKEEQRLNQQRATELANQRLNLIAQLDAAEADQADATAARDTAANELGVARRLLAALQEAGGGNNEELLRQRWGVKAMQMREVLRTVPHGYFTQRPFGPVGMYIRRAPGVDAKYARALESVLENIMRAFVINVHDDQKKFEALAEQRFGSSEGLTAAQVPFTDEVHNYGAQPVVTSDGQRWWRVIDLVSVVDDVDPTTRATLINTLLDRAAAGTTVVVDDREQAHWVAEGGLTFRDVFSAYDPDGTMYESRGSTILTKLDKSNKSVICLAADNRAEMDEAQRAVRDAEARHQQAGEALVRAAEAVAALRRRRQELNREETSAARQGSRIAYELEQLNDRTPSVAHEAASAELMNALQQSQAAAARASASLQASQEAYNNAVGEEQAAAAELARLNAESAQYRQRRQELIAEVNNLAPNKAEAGRALKAAQQRLAAVQEETRRGLEALQGAEAQAQAAEAQALQACSRAEGFEALEAVREVLAAELLERHRRKTAEEREAMLEHAMTAKALQHKVTALAHTIAKAEEAAGGDMGAIQVAAQRARHDVVRLLEAVESVRKKVKVTQEAQEIRDSKYIEIRDKTDWQAAKKFNHRMSARNMTALLKIDHAEERLELSVRKNNEQHKASSLMQLSGGERSFTTASFLLAMGEVIDAPFRAMDEYDVFMDNAARMKVTMALLEFAWYLQPNSQLILLSPQDVKTLDEAHEKLVAVCRRKKEPEPGEGFKVVFQMPDPRHRQR